MQNREISYNRRELNNNINDIALGAVDEGDERRARKEIMGKPKKQTSPRKTGLRRSHLVLDLARRVNGKSPVKVATTKRETGKKLK
ncbi:MAG: hypothetical protein LBC95_00775 [Candidatus Nomurabacteria bacterium]|nr:hypothetical protein [Candidatus Nomurabacteria bacterium]